MPPEVLSGIVNFFILYVLVTLAGTFALAAQEIDLGTAFTASLTCISNVGPGLGKVGPWTISAGCPPFPNGCFRWSCCWDVWSSMRF